MTYSTSLEVFKCPTCGAPLDPEKGASSMKCPYCGASIVIPESLRMPEYSSLSDVSRLAKEGKLEEAAKIYSKITGLKHEYAMESVKSMAGIRNEEPASNYPKAVSQQPMRPSYQTPPQPQPVYPQPKVKTRNASCLSAVIRFIIFIAVLSTAMPAILKALQFKLPAFSQEMAVIPVRFAEKVMSFSPGMSTDPRAIGLDKNGAIFVLDYNNDEVLIFDPEGNRITSIEVSNNGNRIYASEMAVRSDGVVYIPAGSEILVIAENGNALNEIQADFGNIHSIAMGANDVLYAKMTDGIVRFDENGTGTLVITTEKLEEVSGEFPGSGIVGADAQGNIYFSGTFNRAVLKFSPDGEYIDQFGGNSTSNFTPGEFTSPRQITFDGYGRIYIIDFFDVQVFDANFNYINRIEGQFWGVGFDTQNNMYGVTNLSDNVEKYEVQKPAEN